MRTVRKFLSIRPTIALGAYTAEDQIGGLETISSQDLSGAPIIIESIAVTDIFSKSPDLVFYFFNDRPTLAGDNAAFTLSNADGLKLTAQAPNDNSKNNGVGSVQIRSFSFAPFPQGIPIGNPAYMAVKITSGTDFGQVNPLIYRIGIRVDF